MEGFCRMWRGCMQYCLDGMFFHNRYVLLVCERDAIQGIGCCNLWKVQKKGSAQVQTLMCSEKAGTTGYQLLS